MPAPATVHDLFELVKKSALIEDAALRRFVEDLRSSKATLLLPTDLAARLVQRELLTRFQADMLLKGKFKGFRIGEFRVLRPVGVGAMASVYLCRRANGEQVAVKVLPRERADDPEIRKRFEREGRAICNLHHPNIARAYEVGVDEKRYFLVMEFIDGWNLAEFVQQHGRATLSNACSFLRQAAIGLQHIHEMELVHRDIKPANLLVDRNGALKIVDMGLARVLADDEECLTRTKQVLGTADYIAPEQTYDSHEVDIRADIYGLGMTFYFTLTGSAPFGEGPVDQKIVCQRTKAPTPIAALRPEVPPGLVAIFDKMTAKDPRRRYQTPAEVVAALQA
jgi:serine/threonine protein kinase